MILDRLGRSSGSGHVFIGEDKVRGFFDYAEQADLVNYAVIDSVVVKSTIDTVFVGLSLGIQRAYRMQT